MYLVNRSLKQIFLKWMGPNRTIRKKKKSKRKVKKKKKT